MIAECPPSFQPMPSHRILYVGQDLILLETLREALEDCRVVRCPGGSGARTLIESRIGYSLLLLDEELPGTTGRDLTDSARGGFHTDSARRSLSSRQARRDVLARACAFRGRTTPSR
jgi:CheY-like chemotaxis protein